MLKMMKLKDRLVVAAGLMALLLAAGPVFGQAGGVEAAAPRGTAAPAPLTVFEAREWLQIRWPQTMVTHRFQPPAGQARPGALRLLDGDGEPHDMQLSEVRLAPDGSIRSARVHFLASLEPEGAYRYEVHAGEPPAANAAPTAEAGADAIVLDSGVISVRLAAPGVHDYAAPQPMHAAAEAHVAGDPVDAAGPILGVRLASGLWTAPSWFAADDPGAAPKITRRHARITSAGPLFAEAVVEYAFTNGGFYRMTVRLDRGADRLRIDEQADLKTIRASRDWSVVIPVTDADGAFQPDAAWWVTNAGRLPGADEAVKAALAAAGFEPDKQTRKSYAHGQLAWEEPGTALVAIAVWYPYHASAHYLAISELAGLTERGKEAPFVGVIPLHAGNWRGMPEGYNGQLVGYGDGAAALKWPLAVSPHPNTNLHTGEYDPELPYTYVRRQWALLAGAVEYFPQMDAYRNYEGYVNLDDYKDWTLQWPDDPETQYPRLVANPERWRELKGELDDHPAGAALRDHLFFTDSAERRNSLFGQVGAHSPWSSVRGHALVCLGRMGDRAGTPWTSIFRHSGRSSWAIRVDELLSAESLTDEQRLKLKAWTAALAHVLTEPDFNPRGMMAHLGNPNMPINRFFALTFAAGLIPDHPDADRWLDLSADYLRFQLARNVAPNHAWSELISYYMAAASHAVQAAMVLDQNGRLTPSLAELTAAAATFPMYLITPNDPRFNIHVIPGWGHEGHWMIPTQWLPAAAFLRGRQPQWAQDMIWAWDALGRPMEGHHDVEFTPRAVIHADLVEETDLDEPPARIAGRWLPGVGATLRAHAGDPNETYMSFRAGYMVSHSDENQMDFVIYSKGAPLTTLSLFQYALHQRQPFIDMHRSFGWHNRVRFGELSNTGGWPGGGALSQVHRHSSSDSVGYLRAEGAYSPQQWTRQIMLMKAREAAGPTYFVFRESFRPLPDAPGPLQEKWWQLHTDGDDEKLTLRDDGMTFQTQWDAVMEVRFVEPAKVKSESRTASAVGPVYTHAAKRYIAAGSPRVNNDPGYASVNETRTVTAFGPVEPGQDMTVLVYPRGKDEATADARRLDDGVVRLETSEGIDYVFARSQPFSFEQGDVAFRGRAGAVRVYPDEVHLVLAEGGGEVSYQGTTLVSDLPATKVIAVGDLAGQTLEGPKISDAMALPELPGSGEPEVLAPGVRRVPFAGGVAYIIDAEEPIDLDQDGVRFVGRRGAIVVHDAGSDAAPDAATMEQGEAQREATSAVGDVRLVLLDGESIGYRDLAVWCEAGPLDLTFHHDTVTGETAGEGRFLYMTRPRGLRELPTVVVDGQTYAPGTSHDFSLGDIGKTGDPYDPTARGGLLIVPVLPGEHTLEIRALTQPAVFRNWQAWGEEHPGTDRR